MPTIAFVLERQTTSGLTCSGESRGTEMAKAKRKALKPRRFVDAHSDGKLKTLQKTIEKTYDLPHGSVLFVKRGRKFMRRDATVGALRKAWD
jgi:hypothetical protein